MTALTQPELALKGKAPSVSPEEIEQLVLLLGESDGWLTAGEIALLNPKLNERSVRAIANAAAGRIISYPGSPGYLLFRDATVDEINRAIDATEHQAKEMMKRAIGWRRAFHGRKVA